MAGGAKESPRQRMIGMMYLVLTALLALQVSNAVLEKFVFIDLSLQHSISITAGNSVKIMDGIKEAVAKNGGRPDDKAIMDKAATVADLTSKMRTFMHEMRQTIIDKTGGWEEENGVKKLKGGKDYDEQMAYTLGVEGQKNGKAYELEIELNKYVEELGKLVTDPKDTIKVTISKIALAASEIEQFKNDPDQDGKDFALLNFDHTPTVACMAVMSQIEQEVMQAEAKALEYFAKKVGASIPKFDKISAVATAESSVVAAGTKYKASFFLTASSSTAKPSMSADLPIVKTEGGVAFVETMAKGGEFDAQGNSKRKWSGRITLKLPSGDTTMTVSTEYTVVKPVIQVRSAAVQALYLNCGNELTVDVPALGVSYDPSFKAEGAETVAGQKKGIVTVIPSTNKVDLSVYSSGDFIGKESFGVRRVPKPDLVMFSGGRAVDLKQGASAATMRDLEVRAIADEDFRNMLPKDSQYRVNNYVVTLARGRRAVTTQNIDGPKANLTSIASQAKPGDRLVVEVKEVLRMNFRGKTEKVPGVVADGIFTIPLD